MANVRGIELASEIYDLEDTSARNTATTASQTATQAGQTATQASQTATQASQTASAASQTATQADEKIGTLADLLTTVKTNLVAAINEIYTNLTNLINGDNLVTVAPGFTLRKHGNMVFANIATDDMYFVAQASPMVDSSGNNIVIPAGLRPTNDVSVFIADNKRDTIWRLRVTADGFLYSWNAKYDEQDFVLPLGAENTSWQTSFCYSLLPF